MRAFDVPINDRLEQATVRKQHSEILHQFARRANHLDFLSSPSHKNIPLNLSDKSAALLRASHGR
jgi:hypothetical protein